MDLAKIQSDMEVLEIARVFQGEQAGFHSSHGRERRWRPCSFQPPAACGCSSGLVCLRPSSLPSPPLGFPTHLASTTQSNPLRTLGQLAPLPQLLVQPCHRLPRPDPMAGSEPQLLSSPEDSCASPGQPWWSGCCGATCWAPPREAWWGDGRVQVGLHQKVRLGEAPHS